MESKVARTAPLYQSVRGSRIQYEPKSITEISNKLDSRFKIYTEGQTTNQKVYKGMLKTQINIFTLRINRPRQG